MCMGEPAAGMLRGDEQAFLIDAVAERFPMHDFAIRETDDGMVWAVLEPMESDPFGMRFTICRIDPSVIVMIEDRHANRHFCATSNVKDAMDFVRHAIDQVNLAAMNAQPVNLVLQ
jgi:hypothetical protein